MTCCSYGLQDSKKSGRNSLFPEASWMVFSRNRTEHLLLLLRISSQWKRQTVDRQLWLYLQTDNIFCRHICGCFCWLPHIFLWKNRTTKPTQEGELHERKLFLSSANAPEILSYFVVGANTKPLGASAWNLNEKLAFQQSKPFPYLLMLTLTFCFQTSRFGILPCLHWILIRNRKCVIDRKLKFVLMRSAFCRGVGDDSTLIVQV